MSGCSGLTTLPEWIGDCAALSTLNQTNCIKLTALPERIGDCAALTALDLTNCIKLTAALLERIGDRCSSGSATARRSRR